MLARLAKPDGGSARLLGVDVVGQAREVRRQVGPSGRFASVDSVRFLLPGILVHSVILITMHTGTTLRTDIEKGVLGRFGSLPIWRPSALAGMLLGEVPRTSAAVMGSACSSSRRSPSAATPSSSFPCRTS
ncbi:MAG: transporter [Naasia sp.]|nr:transporter [Naasia sp.]